METNNQLLRRIEDVLFAIDEGKEPQYKNVEIIINGRVYRYVTMQEHGHWYVVTN